MKKDHFMDWRAVRNSFESKQLKSMKEEWNGKYEAKKNEFINLNFYGK